MSQSRKTDTADRPPRPCPQDDLVTPWAGCLNLTGGVLIHIGGRYFRLVEVPDPHEDLLRPAGPPAG